MLLLLPSLLASVTALLATTTTAATTKTTTTKVPHLSRDTKSLVKRCTHSATERSCWGDYDLTTDYYNVVPDTGVTREYYLELSNTTAAPDGYSRDVLLVNGTFPGPTLFADWGDTVIVTVYNGLENNGTSIHFHGIRQNMTNQNDGVASITQCPTAPGETVTYTWRATQYGSTWYHSHFGLQAWEGVLGGIIINGPATANYENDMGVMFLNDWTHQTADAMYITAETNGPPTLDNGLINGTNVYGDDMSTLVPYLSKTVSTEDLDDDFAVTVGKSDSVFKWYMAGTTFEVEWANPTLLQIYNEETDWTTSSHVIELPTDSQWVYFIIETTQAVPHPIHLHGHDFFVIAQGNGTYDSTTATLSLDNPPRRDVAMLPSAGYLVIAFETDNPGAWLLHCHIGWHTSEGFALQLVERYSEINALIDYDTLNSTCAAWDDYVAVSGVEEEDSGV
ncbi:multicopper oxidase [Diplocarpon rosae]|nr:multicopper oxidase [Diplocarpon rosae]